MNNSVLIVGAGLSGLIAACELQKENIPVTILDKGKSVGGRLATRRIQEGIADHGAQFFTTRSDIFREHVQMWIEAGVVRVWGHGWSDGSLKRTHADGNPRYVVEGGMNQLAQFIKSQLKDVEIHTHMEVGDIQYYDESFNLTTNNQKAFRASHLILTPPAPQAMKLARSEWFTDTERNELERIAYGPCLCGMFVVEGDVDLPEPGAIQNFQNKFYWIADNKAKGISEQRIITIHAESRWSESKYDAPDEEIAEEMLEGLQPFFIDNPKILETQIKRWRYSVPLTTYPRDYLACENLPLYFAGDGFGGRGRVEGAYLSGYTLGKDLANQLKA